MKNFRRKMQMSSAATITSATRSALSLLVDWEARRVGRDNAYGEVARKVGTSKSWVEKFLAERPGATEPRISLFLRIRDNYEKWVLHYEQEHFNELMKIQKLRSELDAPIEGFDRMVAGQARASAAGKSTGE
jgi:hypothetical protein